MRHEAGTSAFVLGQQHADIFLGFSCFLLEQAKLNKLDILCFCTREGDFYKSVYDAAFNKSASEEFHQNTNLIEVSRLSTFAPSLLNGTTINFSLPFQLYSKQEPGAFLKSLGQEPSDFRGLLELYGLYENEVFEKPFTARRFGKLIQDQVFVTQVYQNLARQRSATKRYLAQHFGGTEKIGIVDIGWHGSIQDAIARLFPEKTFFGMYLGLAPKRSEISNNCWKIAYGPDCNISRADCDLLDAMNVLEFTCLSNKGSAQGYHTHPDGSVTVKVQHIQQEDMCVEKFSLPFQQGVLSIASKANPTVLFQDHLSGNLRTRALIQWRDLLKRPANSLINSYFSLKSNETFGHGNISDQSAVPSYSTVLLSPFSQPNRLQLIDFLKRSQWPEGMIHRTDLTLFTKITFYVLMKIALMFKSISNLISSFRNLVM
jgi:hypothetical protein